MAVVAGTLVLTGCWKGVQTPASWACRPVSGTGTGWQRSFGDSFGLSSPVAADLDGDGREEVVVAGDAGYVHVVRSDGSTVWDQPVLTPGALAPVAVTATPAVIDLDGDGRPEIVVGAQSPAVADQPGGIVVFDAGGAVRWRFSPEDVFDLWHGGPADGYPEGVFGSPAIGDVNGDGNPDVVFGAMDLNVYALDGPTGNVVWKWKIDDAVYGSPAVADTDGNGRWEVYIGAASTPGGPIDHAGGVFVRLEQDDQGRVQARWMQFTSDVLWSSPAIGDIDGDGRLEVVVGSGLDYGQQDPSIYAASSSIYAWHVDDGSALPGWPQVLSSPTRGSVALGDLTGDGVPEVVGGGRDGRIVALAGDGSRWWDTAPEPGSGELLGSPVIADLDGDGDQDVAVAVSYGVYQLDGRTGQVFGARFGGSHQNTPVLVHDPAGWRLVASGASALTAVGVPLVTRAEWPQWRANQAHTGRAHDVAAEAATPCW